MDKKLERKYYMAQISANLYEAEYLKAKVAELDAEDETSATEPEPETKQPAKKAAGKKENKVKEPVAEEVEETSDDSDDIFGDEADEQIAAPTLDDVRKKVKEFASKHGKDKALKLLGKFKVDSIPALKAADYSKVIELANKHL